MVTSWTSEAGASGGAVGGQEGIVLAIGVEFGAAEARRGPEVAPRARRQQNQKRQRETQKRAGQQQKTKPVDSCEGNERRGDGVSVGISFKYTLIPLALFFG